MQWNFFLSAAKCFIHLFFLTRIFYRGSVLYLKRFSKSHPKQRGKKQIECDDLLCKLLLGFLQIGQFFHRYNFYLICWNKFSFFNYMSSKNLGVDFLHSMSLICQTLSIEQINEAKKYANRLLSFFFCMLTIQRCLITLHFTQTDRRVKLTMYEYRKRLLSG